MQKMRGGEGNYFRKQMVGTMGNKWGNLKIWLSHLNMDLKDP
jgi:hypothetical protein